MSYIAIGKMAEKLGVTEQTLRNWDKSGRLKPAYVSDSGYRYYSNEQLAKVTGLFYTDSTKKFVAGYHRSSTKERFKNQVVLIRQYCIAKGYQFKFVPNQFELLDLILGNQISKLVILHKDVLPNFEIIDYICKYNNILIEIIDSTECSSSSEGGDDIC